MNNKSHNIDDLLSKGFASILMKLNVILLDSGNSVQADYVSFITKLLQLENHDQFISSINAVDMWGSSGSV